ESRFVFAICAATAGLSSESPTYRALHSAVRASPSNATIRKRDPGNRYGNVTVEWEGMYAGQPAQGKMRNYHGSHLLSRLIRCRASAGHPVLVPSACGTIPTMVCVSSTVMWLSATVKLGEWCRNASTEASNV